MSLHEPLRGHGHSHSHDGHSDHEEEWKPSPEQMHKWEEILEHGKLERVEDPRVDTTICGCRLRRNFINPDVLVWANWKGCHPEKLGAGVPLGDVVHPCIRFLKVVSWFALIIPMLQFALAGFCFNQNSCNPKWDGQSVTPMYWILSFFLILIFGVLHVWVDMKCLGCSLIPFLHRWCEWKSFGKARGFLSWLVYTSGMSCVFIGGFWFNTHKMSMVFWNERLCNIDGPSRTGGEVSWVWGHIWPQLFGGYENAVTIGTASLALFCLSEAKVVRSIITCTPGPFVMDSDTKKLKRDLCHWWKLCHRERFTVGNTDRAGKAYHVKNGKVYICSGPGHRRQTMYTMWKTEVPYTIQFQMLGENVGMMSITNFSLVYRTKTINACLVNGEDEDDEEDVEDYAKELAREFGLLVALGSMRLFWIGWCRLCLQFVIQVTQAEIGFYIIENVEPTSWWSKFRTIAPIIFLFMAQSAPLLVDYYTIERTYSQIKNSWAWNNAVAKNHKIFNPWSFNGMLKVRLIILLCVVTGFVGMFKVFHLRCLPVQMPGALGCIDVPPSTNASALLWL